MFRRRGEYISLDLFYIHKKLCCAEIHCRIYIYICNIMLCWNTFIGILLCWNTSVDMLCTLGVLQLAEERDKGVFSVTKDALS